MTTETPSVSPLTNPRMLARIITVQIDTKKPTIAQLGAVTAYVVGRYPDAEDSSALAAVLSIAESVVLDEVLKVSILTPVKDALRSGDFSTLIAGSPAAPTPTAPTGRVNPLTFHDPVMDPVPAPSPAPAGVHDVPAAAPAVPDHATRGQDAASLMARAIQLLQATAKPAGPGPLDEDRVKELVMESLSGHLDSVTSNVSSLFASLEERMKETFKVAGVHRIEVGHSDGKTVAIEGATHWQFEQILTWLTANVPVWLWGKAGGGKTHLGRQLAAALDVPAYIVSIDPTITVGKLVGYRNLATGDYVPGLLTAAYRDGGLLMLDEIDTGDPGIIACLNSLLANGHYLFPCGTTVTRHPKFRVIAGANTRGVGATAGYVARQRLDAATLNRFAVIELKYDERLEETLAVGSSEVPVGSWQRAIPEEATCRQWVHWVRKVRAQVGESVLISPRASYLGVAAIRSGVPVAEVAAALVFALTTSDTQRSITSTCGTP